MHPSSINGFLQLDGKNWDECLEKSFEFLRTSWAGDWVGLPLLLDACTAFLNFHTDELSSESVHLLSAAKQVALQIEKDYAASSSLVEPEYHNRLHLADALTSMSVLIAIQSEQPPALNRDWMACALLTVIAHDFGHTGQINQSESEIELKSTQLLRPILANCQVSDAWCTAVESAILHSDFSIVRKNHEQVQGKDFQCNQAWLNVFLNEADVMASASAKYGSRLGESLAQEWKIIGFSAHHSVATRDGRKAFLKQLVFSSWPSKYLQMDQRLAQELSQLES